MINGKNRLSSDRLPLPGESCAYVVGRAYKRSALLFDKIHVYVSLDEQPDEATSEIPESLTFGMGTVLSEAQKKLNTKIIQLSQSMKNELRDVGITPPRPPWPENSDWNTIEEALRIGMEANPEATIALAKLLVQTETQEAVAGYAHRGITVVPIYNDLDLFNTDFPSGPVMAYQAALLNLPIVVEQGVSWQQIIQFRQDAEVARKYRALKTWLHLGLKTGSVQEAADIIGKKLDDYEWAIKKHGLKTVKGVLSQVLEFRKSGITLATAGAAGFVGGPIWSAIAAGMVVTSQIALSLVDRAIELEDIKRGEHSEVGFIYDTRKAFRDDGER